MADVHLTPIGSLIEEQRALNGWSYGDLVQRSGGVISRTRFYQYAKGRIKEMPPVETVQALARALAVPPSVVMDRLMDTLGLPRPSAGGSQSPEDAIMSDPDLNEAQKRLMLETLRQLREKRGYEESRLRFPRAG